MKMSDDDPRLFEAGRVFAPEFLKAQYEALRTEILNTQRRAFQLMTAGVLGLPLLSYFIQGQQPRSAGGPAPVPALPAPGAMHTTGTAYGFVLTMALPVVVIVIALLYLADNNAIIRAGYFIRCRIERYVPVQGWEEWLESRTPLTRGTERHVTVAVYILFLLYYVASVYLSWPAAREEFGTRRAAYAMAGYAVLGASVAAYFVWQILLSTTALERRFGDDRRARSK